MVVESRELLQEVIDNSAWRLKEDWKDIARYYASCIDEVCNMEGVDLKVVVNDDKTLTLHIEYDLIEAELYSHVKDLFTSRGFEDLASKAIYIDIKGGDVDIDSEVDIVSWDVRIEGFWK